jgi:hypothetical protein
MQTITTYTNAQEMTLETILQFLGALLITLFVSCSLYYKRVMIVIYDHSHCGLYYKLDYDRN